MVTERTNEYKFVGRWNTLGVTEQVLIQIMGDDVRIRNTTGGGLTVLQGEFQPDGSIAGSVLQNDSSGGKFFLKPFDSDDGQSHFSQNDKEKTMKISVNAKDKTHPKFQSEYSICEIIMGLNCKLAELDVESSRLRSRIETDESTKRAYTFQTTDLKKQVGETSHEIQALETQINSDEMTLHLLQQQVNESQATLEAMKTQPKQLMQIREAQEAKFELALAHLAQDVSRNKSAASPEIDKLNQQCKLLAKEAQKLKNELERVGSERAKLKKKYKKYKTKCANEALRLQASRARDNMRDPYL